MTNEELKEFIQVCLEISPYLDAQANVSPFFQSTAEALRDAANREERKEKAITTFRTQLYKIAYAPKEKTEQNP